jgi:hypothetical protein
MSMIVVCRVFGGVFTATRADIQNRMLGDA